MLPPDLALPHDCTLLPLAAGRLAVSRSHAVFCRIPAPWVAAVEAVLAGQQSPASLPDELSESLRRHGFFDPPRPPAPDPPSVQLQLTNACNLSCSYCCTNSAEPRRGELGRAEWFRIVDDATRALGPGLRIALLGGEPLLVPWALDLAEHILSRKAQLTLFTNGLLLADDERARRVAGLIEQGAEVRVSLGGPTAGSCDQASGAARFEQAVDGLHRVARSGAKPIVDLMLLPQHVGETAEHLCELRSLLPAGIKLTFGILYQGGREQGRQLFESRAGLEAALDRIAFEAGESIPKAGPSPLADRREGCTCALGNHLHVRSDGTLFTCFKMEEAVGQLGSQDFVAAWQEVRARPQPAATLARCVDCALATLCGGGCRSENLQLTGSGDEPACGPWRVRVLCELLAEDRTSALHWPALHLLSEAHARGIEAPAKLSVAVPSRHLIDT